MASCSLWTLKFEGVEQWNWNISSHWLGREEERKKNSDSAVQLLKPSGGGSGILSDERF